MNYKQLIFAREYRGFTQTQLAKRIEGLSQSNLSKFEKGVSLLSDDIIHKIISFLNFPVEFFDQRISIVCEDADYRKKASVTKTQKSELDYSNKLIGYLVDQMANSIEWPEFKLKAMDLEEGYSPQYVAKYIRKLLKLKKDEPVRDIYHLLESQGIIVVELDAIDKFDGVSFLTDDGYPIIVTNKSFSNDRKRFTLAHELGHIIMHKAGGFPIPEFRNREEEANLFASEFLMPEDAIKNSLRGLKLSYLSELKRYWLTSMASLIRRAKDLSVLSNDKYTYLNIELSRKGYRKREPIDVYIDNSSLFRNGYLLHTNELEYSDMELAKAFNLPLDVIEKFCNNSKSFNSRLKVVN